MYGGDEPVPPAMLADVQEIAAKGYDAVEIFPLVGEIEFLREFCRTVASLNLEIWVLTNYMKYQEKYLAEHPDERMVLAKEARDQDGLSISAWGCPFNPNFKKRGLAWLREVAEQPGVTRIGLNDEAMLNSGCYCEVCRADYQREIGGEMPLVVQPDATHWEDAKWREYLQWRMKRWNAVHAEQAAAIRAINPNIRVLFQTSPACDLWINPWQTGVDLTAMTEFLDGLSTDPYYTFHDRQFHPAEVYLSEWSRFLRSIVPPHKETEIVTQGFSHPTFSRPLTRDDGYWAAIVPPACGIDINTPYAYTYQRCSPSQETYEACFALDGYFERAKPLSYAGVVHGAQTEIYGRPIPSQGPESYDWSRLLPVTESLRHRGLPYAYLPDTRLHEKTALTDYKALVLPEVNCLSGAQEDGLREYVGAGGNLIVLGGLGSADCTGMKKSRALLEELFGVEIVAEYDGDKIFTVTGEHPATHISDYFDESRARRIFDGSYYPQLALRYCVEAKLPAGAEVLAEFVDADGRASGHPAVAVLPSLGKALWFAGFPSRTVTHPLYKTNVLNRAHSLFASAARWAAGELPPLRVENWPPLVPMKELRPVDPRNIPTFEFFPLAGDNVFLGVVASYFKEPARFPMILDIPPGKKLLRVMELIENRETPFDVSGGQATICVQMDFDSAARVYFFEMESGG